MFTLLPGSCYWILLSFIAFAGLVFRRVAPHQVVRWWGETRLGTRPIVAALRQPWPAASSNLLKLTIYFTAEPSLQIMPVQFEMHMRLVSQVLFLPIRSILGVALTLNDHHLRGFGEHRQPSVLKMGTIRTLTYRSL